MSHNESTLPEHVQLRDVGLRDGVMALRRHLASWRQGEALNGSIRKGWM